VQTRSGCYFCFKVLDPQDVLEEFRTFVKCRDCGTLYHDSCIGQGKKCLRCDSAVFDITQVLLSPAHPPVRSSEMLQIQRSAIVYCILGKEFIVPEAIYKEILPLLLLTYRQSVDRGQCFYKQVMVPVYHEHIAPTIQKLKKH